MPRAAEDSRNRVPAAPVRDTGGISDAPSGAEYLLVLLAGALMGAIIAILTK